MAKQKGIIAYAFSVLMFLGLYISMIQRAVSEIGIQYSLDNTAMGTIIMMTFVGYFISPILTGEATDRFGRKTVLLFAYIGMLLGFLFTALIGTPVGIGIGFAVNGMAMGIIELSMSSMLTDLCPNEANRILNTSRIYFAVGTVSGPFLAMGLISLTSDWVSVMIGVMAVLSVLFVIFLMLSYPVPKYPNQTVESTDASITFRLLKDKFLLILCAAMVMYLAIEAGLTYYVSSYIAQMTPNALFSSLTLSGFWLCMAIGRYVAAKFKGNLNALVGCMSIIAGLGLIVCILTANLLVSMIAFGIMGLGCSGMFPTLLAMGKIRFPKYTGTVFGILLSSAAIGGIVQPFIIGAVADAGGLKIALATCLAPILIMFLTQIALHTITQGKTRQQPKDDELSEEPT